MCNPLTSDGCDPGSQCTLATWDSDYECTGPYGELALCAPCDPLAQFVESSQTCAAGTWCHGGSCQRYCCDDGDCAEGTCVKEAFYPHVGVLGFCHAP